jgi:Holliday junction resolvase RusA-like endonuclease
LDFTYSIWIAAYFAMEQAEGECAVWAVDPRWANSESIKKLEAAAKPNAYMICSETRFDENSERKIETLLFKGQQIKLVCSLNPFRLNDRLRTQSGVFLVPGDVRVSFMQNLEALPGSEKVLKVIIPHELRIEEIKLLSRMKISRTSLFPGLDGYAQSLGVYHPGTDPGWLDDGIRRTTSAFIEGIPYCRFKTRGNTEGRRTWTEKVRKTTMNLPKIKGPCCAEIEFCLPRDKYPNDYPSGPDLDNLLKPLLDALNTTVLSEAPGKDSCIVRLSATKNKVSGSGTDRFGARVKLVELPSHDY